MTQLDRANAFKSLHDDDGMFIIPNPWDVGSAKILEQVGYKALATTSSGFMASRGLQDYQATLEMKLAHIRQLADATALPLSADLENGFGDEPEICAETIRLGAEAGLVGGSIEDFSGDKSDPIYELEFAAERVRAGVEMADSFGFPFLLTARSENHLHGRFDLADTIKRLQAYQEAGAHLLYAPGLSSLADIRSVVQSVDRPLNVLLGPFDGIGKMSDLADIGVKRVSVGGAFSDVAYGALRSIAESVLADGTFGLLPG